MIGSVYSPSQGSCRFVNPKFEKKIRFLIEHIPELIQKLKWEKGPGLYFYQRTLALRRGKPLNELFDDRGDRYVELIYATLASWNMNSRAARMKYFDQFKSSILDSRSDFLDLSEQALDTLTEEEFTDIKSDLVKIYSKLDLMNSGGRLVANSKTMHFILPDLVMPIDRENTLKFFFGYTTESETMFPKILECSYRVTRKLNLRKLLDKEWNLNITKVIDNAIIEARRQKE